MEYFPQKCSYCCSANAVAMVYNDMYGDSIDEYDLFERYPEWVSMIREPIGTERLKLFVDDIFGDSKIKRGDFRKDIDKYIILYISNKDYPEYGHYTPVLDYIDDKVLIGESGTHKETWIPYSDLKERVREYIII